MKKTSLRCSAILLFLVSGAAINAADVFPQPAELQPDVDFWLSIFTRYSTEEGVLHDNRDLSVVYERIDMPASLSRRERQKRVTVRRKALQSILRVLASGKRDNLTTEQARVLALWPADISNRALQEAAGRIRFQQGLRDRFRAGLARSGRWRTYVNEQLTALGVPTEIAALPHVESSYDPSARSHVGASGIWQFTRSTGRRFMRVDHVIDERNDPFASTRAAGQLMAYNYSLTGNWPMAITAYNHGLAGVRRAMKQYGDTAYVQILRNYDGRTFGFASRNFYVAFLAAKQVDQNAETYFPGLVFEEPEEYSTARLPAFVAAAGLAKALGRTPAELAAHNPGLQATIWTGNKYLPRGYEVRMPAAGLGQSLQTIVSALPSDIVYDKQLPDLFHRVKRGDTLSGIATAYDTRVSTLVALNNLNSRHRIRAGQDLRLPAAGPAPAKRAPAMPVVVAAAPQANDASGPAIEVVEAAPQTLSDETATAVPAEIQTPLLSDPSDYSVADDDSIEVQPLETLGHYGDWLEIKTQRLRDINGLSFRAPVEVGRRIKLDLRKVDARAFEERRIAYHRMQQDSFFRLHVITGLIDYEIRAGDSIWVLALRKYNVPIWLFRQYNPSLDLDSVRPGTRVKFPVLNDVEPD